MPGLVGAAAGPASTPPRPSSLVVRQGRSHAGKAAGSRAPRGRDDDGDDDNHDDDDGGGNMVVRRKGDGAATTPTASSAPDEIVMCFHVGKGNAACAAYYVVAEVRK